MRHQLICGAGIYALLFWCSVVKSHETVNDAFKIRQEDSTNIFLTKEMVERLLIEVEILQKKSNSEMSALKVIQSQSDDQTSDDGVCERISSYFNSTLRKYNQFEDRVVTKLNEIQDEQTENINKLVVRQNLSKNCQQGSALDIMSEAMSEMTEKIDNLETQLKTVQAANDEQMKVLKDISAKLTQQQEKFDKFEKELPGMVQARTISGGASPQAQHALPMSLILGMTQKQGPAKTN